MPWACLRMSRWDTTMTSNNGDRHGEFPGFRSEPGRSRLPADLNRQPHFDAIDPSDTEANDTVSGPGSAPTAGRMELPPNFHTAHFLDPSFITGLANDLYAEGRPPLALS